MRVPPHDEVALLPFAALAGRPSARLEVRQSRLASAIAGSISALIAIIAACAPFVWPVATGPLLAAFWIGGLAALMAWLYLRNAFRTGGAQGWVLREDGAHLWVNLRSHLNTHFDPATPSVLVLPRPCVRSLSVVRERGVRTHVGDNGVVFENPIQREFLDIAFDGDADAVAAALNAEGKRMGKATLGASRSNHSAVRLLPNGVLRIAWRDETNRLRPGLDAVRREFQSRYHFIAAAATSAQTPFQDLDRAAQEARLIEMVTRGERIAAVALSKVTYDLDTTEAVRFIDSLRHDPAGTTAKRNQP